MKTIFAVVAAFVFVSFSAQAEEGATYSTGQPQASLAEPEGPATCEVAENGEMYDCTLVMVAPDGQRTESATHFPVECYPLGEAPATSLGYTACYEYTMMEFRRVHALLESGKRSDFVMAKVVYRQLATNVARLTELELTGEEENLRADMVEELATLEDFFQQESFQRQRVPDMAEVVTRAI